MNRAYSILNVKGMTDDAEFVYVEGIASTPTTDRQGDSVDPMGAKFAAPMPLLWQHDAQKPVGHMTFAKPTKTGIPFKAQIPKVTEPGTLKDRVDEAIQSLKYGLVSAVSIGFRIMEDGYEVMKGGGYRINSWEWMELSLVTIPANSEALISQVKALDSITLAALGDKRDAVEDPLPPSDLGNKPTPRRPINLRY